MSFNPLVSKTRSSNRKTLILIDVAKYGTVIRILVRFYFVKVNVTLKAHVSYMICWAFEHRYQT